MDKRKKADATIDYIRKNTAGIPDEFLPQIA